METAIKIGHEISKQSSENVSKAIERIFRVGYSTHMDQKTICKALDAMTRSFSIDGLTVTGCNITGDKVVNV